MGLCAVAGERAAARGATGACRAPAVASKSEATSVLEVDELRAMVCEACSVSSVRRRRCKLCHTEEMMRCGCFTCLAREKTCGAALLGEMSYVQIALGSCKLVQAMKQARQIAM